MPAVETIQCRNCKKDRKVVSATVYQGMCTRCHLIVNKVLLHKCYNGIIDHPEMQQFDKNMEMWYTTK